MYLHLTIYKAISTCHQGIKTVNVNNSNNKNTTKRHTFKHHVLSFEVAETGCAIPKGLAPCFIKVRDIATMPRRLWNQRFLRGVLSFKHQMCIAVIIVSLTIISEALKGRPWSLSHIRYFLAYALEISTQSVFWHTQKKYASSFCLCMRSLELCNMLSCTIAPKFFITYALNPGLLYTSLCSIWTREGNYTIAAVLAFSLQKLWLQNFTQ